MPFYCSLTEVPKQLEKGDINNFSFDSNFWMNNWVANQAYNRYDLMIPDIRKVQENLENEFISSRPKQEKTLLVFYENGDTENLNKAVNEEAAKIAKKATDDYRDLAVYLFVKFMDGNMKKTNDDGSFKLNQYGIPASPSFPGYDMKYYENIVKEKGDHFQLPPSK